MPCREQTKQVMLDNLICFLGDYSWCSKHQCWWWDCTRNDCRKYLTVQERASYGMTDSPNLAYAYA